MRTVKTLCIVALSMGSMTCTSQPVRDDAAKEVFQMSDAPNLPFSSAVRAGDLLFLSGQIGNVPGTLELVDGGIGPETRQALDNIRAVVEYAGSSMERIVKCTVFLQDIADYADMNAVYSDVFGANPPARSTVAGSGLAIGASVEVECIALAGSTD